MKACKYVCTSYVERENPTYISTNYQSLLDVLQTKTFIVKVLLQTISKEAATSKRLFV